MPSRDPKQSKPCITPARGEKLAPAQRESPQTLLQSQKDRRIEWTTRRTNLKRAAAKSWRSKSSTSESGVSAVLCSLHTNYPLLISISRSKLLKPDVSL